MSVVDSAKQQSSLSSNQKGGKTASVVTTEFKYRGPKEVQDFVVVLYDYTAQRSDELDLVKGAELLVLVRENEQWWLGELTEPSKQQGFFPASYVQGKQAFEEQMAASRQLKQNKNNNNGNGNCKISKTFTVRNAAFNQIQMPKYSVRDAMDEFERTYEQNNNAKAAINSISNSVSSNSSIRQPQIQPQIQTRQQRPPRTFNKKILTTPMRNEENNSKSVVSNIRTINTNNNTNNQTQVNTINELPTKDTQSVVSDSNNSCESSHTTNTRTRNRIRRRPFSHMIVNNASDLPISDFPN